MADLLLAGSSLAHLFAHNKLTKNVSPESHPNQTAAGEEVVLEYVQINIIIIIIITSAPRTDLGTR
jgi:hypothetical protein